MKTSTLTSIMILALTAIMLIYGLILSQPSQNEVDSKTSELTPVAERSPINLKILDNTVIKEVEASKVFGVRPVGTEALNRSNPFEGI